MKTIADISYINDGLDCHKLDIHLPERESFDTVLYFHGGGLQNGNRKLRDAQLQLVESGLAVVSAEYRLLPDAKFPDFLEDGAAAVAFVQKHGAEYGLGGRLILLGNSAGAWMVNMLTLSDQWYTAAGADPDGVAAVISDSSQMLAHFGILESRGFDRRLERIDETAPIWYVREGMKLPPMLFLYYTEDIA